MPKSASKKKKKRKTPVTPLEDSEQSVTVVNEDSPSTEDSSLVDLAENPQLAPRILAVAQRLTKLISGFVDASLPTTEEGAVSVSKQDDVFAGFLSSLQESGGAISSTSLQVADAELWGRLSFLNEITLRTMRKACGEEPVYDTDSGDTASTSASFKDEFVNMFTSAFADDLETLQNDKFLNALGGASAVRCREAAGFRILCTDDCVF